MNSLIRIINPCIHNSRFRCFSLSHCLYDVLLARYQRNDEQSMHLITEHKLLTRYTLRCLLIKFVIGDVYFANIKLFWLCRKPALPLKVFVAFS